MNEQTQPLGLTPPLRVAQDMPGIWRNLDRSFDEAAELLVAAHAGDGKPRDQPVMDLRTWALTQDEGHFALKPLANHAQPIRLRSTALSNLCTRLGAPAEFLRDKLPAELQMAVGNYLLASQPNPLPSQLRLRGDEVSAVVSDRYAALDAEAFVETIRAALVEQGLLNDVRVRALATGTTDAMRLVLPGEGKALKVGDVSHVGLDVSTSSFSKSAIHLAGLLYRLVCANGLRAPTQIGRFSFRHIGDTQRLRDGLRDAVPTALLHARGFMSQWQRAVGTYVDHVADTIQAMRELTMGERDLVTQELKQAIHVNELPESASAYDLTNAITAAAHEALPARRLELESFAGQFLQSQLGRA